MLILLELLAWFFGAILILASPFIVYKFIKRFDYFCYIHSIFKYYSKNKAPHEIFPEIIEWEIGDSIEYYDYTYDESSFMEKLFNRFGGLKFRSVYTKNYQFRGIDSLGRALFSNNYKGEINMVFEIDSLKYFSQEIFPNERSIGNRVVKIFENKSYEKRKRERQLQEEKRSAKEEQEKVHSLLENSPWNDFYKEVRELKKLN